MTLQLGVDRRRLVALIAIMAALMTNIFYFDYMRLESAFGGNLENVAQISYTGQLITHMMLAVIMTIALLILLKVR